jgi:uncharacterized protein YpmB
MVCVRNITVNTLLKGDKIIVIIMIIIIIIQSHAFFWKYVYSFRKNDKNSIEHEVDGTHLHVFNNAYLRHFSSAFGPPTPSL